MEPIVFESHLFKNVTSTLLYQMLKLRADVFVVEQNCVYPDLDNKDLHKQAVHLVAKYTHLTETSLGDGNEPIAYARCLPPNLSYAGSSIGRVVVNKNYRGNGVAAALMNEAIKICLIRWPNVPIEIGAQFHLEGFYQKLGFVSVSSPYDEDGIMHIDMKLGE